MPAGPTRPAPRGGAARAPKVRAGAATRVLTGGMSVAATLAMVAGFATADARSQTAAANVPTAPGAGTTLASGAAGAVGAALAPPRTVVRVVIVPQAAPAVAAAVTAPPRAAPHLRPLRPRLPPLCPRTPRRSRSPPPRPPHLPRHRLRWQPRLRLQPHRPRTPAAEGAEVETRFPTMGTTAHVVVLGGRRSLATAAQRRLEDLDARWSRFRPDSEVSRLNAAAGAHVPTSAETALLVRRMVDAWELTAGLCDASVHDAVLAAGYDRTFAALPPAGSPPNGSFPGFPRNAAEVLE